MASIASMTPQAQSPHYSSDEPPLIRGGSESVYMVHRLRSTDTSWGRAARRSVTYACNRYDDARVGQVKGLQCQIGPDGISFEAELAISTRYHGGE